MQQRNTARCRFEAEEATRATQLKPRIAYVSKTPPVVSGLMPATTQQPNQQPNRLVLFH